MLPFSDRLSFPVKKVFFLLMVAFVLQAAPCQAKEIDVELVWKFKEAGWIKVQVEQGNYTLKEVDKDKQIETPFPAGSALELTWGGWSPALKKNYDPFQIWRGKELELNRKGEYGSFLVQTPDGQKVSYRGSLKIRWEDGGCKLINRVEQEDYLKGVVPIEMSNSWAVDGLEALKAQAVAARTYMVRKTRATTQITDSPDYDQAYLGRNVEGTANQAVESTRGEIMVDSITYQPIDALYSSHNGGYTERAENVWSNPDPHFTSQPDPFSQGIGGPADRWRFIIGADVLGQAFEMGPIAKIELDKLPSGRVKKVSIRDIDGKVHEVGGRAFVQKFYPYGQPITVQAFLGNLFNVQQIPGDEPLFSFDLKELGVPSRLSGLVDKQKVLEAGSGPRLGRILSTAQGIREFPASYDVFVFNGRGWGHGVGMSQWGAYQMAQRGYTYGEILKFYYQQMDLIKYYL
ncbi:MAG TPA: SpoIID/LytB domain-containing protein [Desulfitobacterium dehalogenans]|uniref:SpoIID/LytB domain-containing protein n=1 Tax=Desulfitobacterium dehalogenans TaxID=36854 RepID=A0A7C6Z3S6_9FIRM|nr:SpoIID/LytB domain-containing protein [Desulfitobacterium dehalogenans]